MLLMPSLVSCPTNNSLAAPRLFAPDGVARHLLPGAALTLLLTLSGFATAAAAPVPASAQSAVSPLPAVVAPMTGPQVIQLLDQTIDCYRTLGIQQQAP